MTQFYADAVEILELLEPSLGHEYDLLVTKSGFAGTGAIDNAIRWFRLDFYEDT